MHYTQHYLEEIALRDGAFVRLRLVRPGDKPRLREIMAGMSPGSRRMRFLGPRDQLTERELAYLTEVDGIDHLAILATRGFQGVGVARFVRVGVGGRVAEPAMAIVDRFQGRGLGRLLLGRLAAAARERGVERFEGEVLATNRSMLHLLGELDGSAAPPPMHGCVTRVVELRGIPGM